MKEVAIVSVFSLLISCYFTSLYYKDKINTIELKNRDEIIKTIKKNSDDNAYNTKIINELKDKERESYEKLQKLQKDNDKLLANVNDGSVGLFVKTEGDSCSTESVSKDKSTSISDGKAGKVRIDRRTSAKLVEMTKRADKYKAQLEELQDYINNYNEKIDQINKKSIDNNN